MSAGHTGSVHKTRIVDKRESTAKHIASFPFTKPIKPHIYENREEHTIGHTHSRHLRLDATYHWILLSDAASATRFRQRDSKPSMARRYLCFQFLHQFLLQNEVLVLIA